MRNTAKATSLWQPGMYWCTAWDNITLGSAPLPLEAPSFYNSDKPSGIRRISGVELILTAAITDVCGGRFRTGSWLRDFVQCSVTYQQRFSWATSPNSEEASLRWQDGHGGYSSKRTVQAKWLPQYGISNQIDHIAISSRFRSFLLNLHNRSDAGIGFEGEPSSGICLQRNSVDDWIAMKRLPEPTPVQQCSTFLISQTAGALNNPPQNIDDVAGQVPKYGNVKTGRWKLIETRKSLQLSVCFSIIL